MKKSPRIRFNPLFSPFSYASTYDILFILRIIEKLCACVCYKLCPIFQSWRRSNLTTIFNWINSGHLASLTPFCPKGDQPYGNDGVIALKPATFFSPFRVCLSVCLSVSLISFHFFISSAAASLKRGGWVFSTDKLGYIVLLIHRRVEKKWLGKFLSRFVQLPIQTVDIYGERVTKLI